MSLSLLFSAALTACGGGGGDSTAQPSAAYLTSAAAAAAAITSIATMPASMASTPEIDAAIADTADLVANAPAAADLSYLYDLPNAASASIAATDAAQAFTEQAVFFAAPFDAANAAVMAAAGPSPEAKIQAATLEQSALGEPAAYPSSEALRSSSLFLPARTATENWTAAKLLIKSDVNWANWVNSKKAWVDKWFGKSRDRADLVAGYPNGLVNTITGAAVRWSMDMAEPPAGTTAEEIAYKGAWSAINRQNNVSYALDAARIYQLTGETRYADIAAAQLDFYANNYMSWPLRTAIGNGRMFGQSLDEAASVLELLEAAHALKAYVTPARQNNWRDGLLLPMAANLQTYSYGPLNNINLWCAIATTAIGLALNNQTLIDTGTTGPKSIAAVMAQGVTKDGIWFEGTFAYNNYVLLALSRFFDTAAAYGRNDLVTRYIPDVQRLLMAPAVYRFDDGSLPSPGDTRSAVRPVDLPTHGAFYRSVPTSYGLQYASVVRSWATLMDRPPASFAPPALPPAQTIFSPDIRMASIRSGNWQLFVHFGQKTINHAQEEALTYELVQGTTSVTRDAGAATSYSSPQQNEYFAKGVGNNVPLIDGLGQEQWAPGQVLGFDPVAGTLDVLHPTYRRDISARRSYRLDANGFSETTRINVTSGNAAPRRLGVMFNTTCDVQVSDPRAGLATASAAPLGAPGFKYWTGVLKHQAQAVWTAKLACNGGKHYEMTITGQGPHTVYRATAPNTPLPATRRALYVETTGTNTTFTTSIKAVP